VLRKAVSNRSMKISASMRASIGQLCSDRRLIAPVGIVQMSLGIGCIVYVAGCDDHHRTFRWRSGTPRTCGLFTRNDNDFTTRFPLAVARTKVKNPAAPPVRREAEESGGGSGAGRHGPQRTQNRVLRPFLEADLVAQFTEPSSSS
jgi:hypothetical protein